MSAESFITLTDIDNAGGLLTEVNKYHICRMQTRYIDNDDSDAKITRIFFGAGGYIDVAETPDEIKAKI